MASISDLKLRLEHLEPSELGALGAWLEERERWRRGELRDCFVIMPFSDTKEGRTGAYWTNFFDHFLTRALKDLGYRAIRSNADPTNIVKGIMEDLAWRDTVLAVLTDQNPNVWYELGVRHSLRKGTVMICHKGQAIPFDLKHHGVVLYEPSLDPKALARELPSHFAKVDDQSEDSPVSTFLPSGLMHCINHALGGRREAMEVLKEGRTLGESEVQLLTRVDAINAQWKVSSMELTILHNDKILRHSNPTLVPDGFNANLCWKDTTLDNQSLYLSMRARGEGVNLGSIEGYSGRITALAYGTLTGKGWMVVAETHVKQGGL